LITSYLVFYVTLLTGESNESYWTMTNGIGDDDEGDDDDDDVFGIRRKINLKLMNQFEKQTDTHTLGRRRRT